MAKYQRYAEYKDSGVEWADALPLDWKHVHLRWISNIYAGGTPSKTNLGYWENGVIPWLNSGSVNQSLISTPSTYITNEAFNNSSTRWISKGSLVVALAGQGKTKGMVAQLGIDSSCNQSMAAIVLYDKSYSRYLFWWLTSNYQNIRNMAGGDLRDGLNLEHLGSIHFPLPSKAESLIIANFLDHETAKIDSLIEKQKKLIELLKEKRQAVISHAVTKGLNPDVPMKDSGVEWLGEVPEHWIIGRLRWKIKIASGEGITSLNIAKDYEINKSIPVIGGNGVMGFFNKINSMNSIAIGRVGALCGNVHWIDYESWITDNALKISKWHDFEANYLVYLLKVARLNDLASKTAQPLITGEQIKSLKVIIPNITEQKAIVVRIELVNRSIKKLISKAEQAIQLMQERRTALISSAVTGKIDVRHWQAPNQSELEQSA